MYSFTLSLTSAVYEGKWLTPRPGRFSPRKDPVPIEQGAAWASEQFWTGVENLAPTGIRYPERSARSESLYRLSYPGPGVVQVAKKIVASFEVRHIHLFVGW
jgi:hypothetical protein